MQWLGAGGPGRLLRRAILAPVALVCALAGGWAPAARAAEDSGSAVESSPCLLWGDVLPAKLGRANARQAVLCLLNEERAAAGLPGVDLDRRLQRASQRHTAAMHGTGCFSHQCPGEPPLERRFRRYLAGHPRRYELGEVIGWGPRVLASPREIVDTWLRSPLHRGEILNPTYEDAGIGFAVGTPKSGHSHGGIYSIDFGMRIG